jgi:hypothetical protein
MAIPTIKRTAESYKILEQVYKRIDGGKYADAADGKWSFFQEMLAVKDLRQKAEEDPEWNGTFSRWVGEGRIPRAENVRDLTSILTKSKARHIFENEPPSSESFEKALMEAETTNPGKRSRLFKTLQKLIDECNKAPFSDIDLAGQNDSAKILLTEAYQSIGSFMERSGVRLPSPRRVA